MELLPKDIIAIVQRYVFDANYSDLKQQYKQKWLNDIYWDDNNELFAFKRNNTHTLFVANWRNWIKYDEEIIRTNGIRQFHYDVHYYMTSPYVNMIEYDLPKRYFH